MNCPVDATPLQVVTRDDVEIDVCPDCRGVWLDRGELQQLFIRMDLDALGSAPVSRATASATSASR